MRYKLKFINLKTDEAMGYNSMNKMKKRIFLVSTLVVMAFTAMFVSCKKGGSIENGCTCTMTGSYASGETETVYISGEEMKEIADKLAKNDLVVINTCSDYADYVMRFWHEIEGSVSCK